MPTEKTQFQRKLRHERELRGWSQQDLACHLGTDASRVNKWENGMASPSTYYRQKLIELFGKNAEELGLLTEENSEIDFTSSPFNQQEILPEQMSLHEFRTPTEEPLAEPEQARPLPPAKELQDIPQPLPPKRGKYTLWQKHAPIALVACIVMIGGIIGLFVFRVLPGFISSPTRTQSPADLTQTATPYPPAGWRLTLSDPLDKSLYWQNGSDTAGDFCQFSHEAYHVILPKAGNGFCAPPTNLFSNLTIEVTMTIIKGDCGGIWFRANGPAYLFQFCRNGHYDLFLYGSPTPPGIQTLLSSASQAFHSGLNRSNLIAVVAIEDHFDLYVNHQKIDSTSNSFMSSGHILFGAAGAVPTEVAYRNARIWTP
ncbi:MAG: helix-turn-helix transcriptional regulator [Ktedonobacteraceae bacterium]|nr:helix-turn-helix transcriptional regulator [Ktedonobacteraceae bacterium]